MPINKNNKELMKLLDKYLISDWVFPGSLDLSLEMCGLAPDQIADLRQRYVSISNLFVSDFIDKKAVGSLISKLVDEIMELTVFAELNLPPAEDMGLLPLLNTHIFSETPFPYSLKKTLKQHGIDSMEISRLANLHSAATMLHNCKVITDAMLQYARGAIVDTILDMTGFREDTPSPQPPKLAPPPKAPLTDSVETVTRRRPARSPGRYIPGSSCKVYSMEDLRP